MSSGYQEKSVLVVDNSSFMTRLIKQFLVNIGFHSDNIMMAQEGNQALLMIGLKNFDLITTGIHLKLKDGLRVLKEIRKNPEENINKIPVIFISAEKKDYYSQQLEPYGLTRYLQKPFRPEQLENTIERIFSTQNLADGSPAQSEKPSPTPPSGENPPIPEKIIEVFMECTQDALGQYMVQASVKKPTTPKPEELSGDYSSLIHLTDETHGIQAAILIYFSQTTACKIYEGIFGEVDQEQVPGLVQELGNILGGIVKPKIADLNQEIIQLVYPEKNTGQMNGTQLKFQLGLPQLQTGPNHTVTLPHPGASRFALPFEIMGEEIILLVQFQQPA